MRGPLNLKVPWKRLTPLQNRRLERELREAAKRPDLSQEKRRRLLVVAGNLKQIRLRLAKKAT